MLVAAYLVGGFLDRVGVRGRHAARAPRPLPPARASSSRSRSPRSRRRSRWLVGDTLARWVYNNEPVKFAAIELVPKTASDVPETLFGHLNSDDTGQRRHPDPRSRVDPVRSGDRDEHAWCKGLNTVPASNEPTIHEVNVVHLAWDVMVGIATLLFLLVGVVRGWRGCSAATSRNRSCSSGSRPAAGVAVGRSRWRPGGSSPRSADNRGSCTTT